MTTTFANLQHNPSPPLRHLSRDDHNSRDSGPALLGVPKLASNPVKLSNQQFLFHEQQQSPLRPLSRGGTPVRRGRGGDKHPQRPMTRSDVSMAYEASMISASRRHQAFGAPSEAGGDRPASPNSALDSMTNSLVSLGVGSPADAQSTIPLRSPMGSSRPSSRSGRLSAHNQTIPFPRSQRKAFAASHSLDDGSLSAGDKSFHSSVKDPTLIPSYLSQAQRPSMAGCSSSASSRADTTETRNTPGTVEALADPHMVRLSPIGKVISTIFCNPR